MICEPAMAILRSGLSQWDAQCALHRLSISGDYTELDELTDEQRRWVLSLPVPQTIRERLDNA